jgi:hypothetical protein
MDGSSAIKSPSGQNPITGELSSCMSVHLLRDHVEADGLRSGDLGDFASFVAHMKRIAMVRSLLLTIPEPPC